jgi:TldD protein
VIHDGFSRREFFGRVGRASGAFLASGAVLGSTAELLAAAGEPVATSGGLSEKKLEGVLADLVADLERKAPFATALYTEQSSLSVETQDREKSTTASPRVAGVVFRAFDGRSFQELATSEVTSDGLRKAARTLKGELQVLERPMWEMNPGEELAEGMSTSGYMPRQDIPLEVWRRRADAVHETVRGLDARIRSASVELNGFWYRSIYVSRNRRLRQSLLRMGLVVALFGQDAEARGRAFLRKRVQGGLASINFEPDDLQRLKKELSDTMGAGRVPPGAYRVVTAPPVTGLLAHESFGHGVEYDQFIKGRARAAQFLGKRVAPAGVQIWDDPGRDGQNGSYFFDDEGWSSSATQIVKDGEFVQPITDQYSAAIGKMRRTANGRRQDYSHKAYARMSNTFFGPGSTPAAEILAAAGDGILLDGFQSGMEDPHGWGIQLMCRTGHEFKSGELTGRVFSPVSVTGYVPDILGSITHISDSFALVPGNCGKGHKEFVPVSTGGPHLVLDVHLG